MELAALIAGVALATFPYSAEFNGKIKYIRDFFITLFFAALGMQIPVPSAKPIFTALLIAICVLLFRWLGIFCLVYILGGSARLGILATINLSQISEFALVICSLGAFDELYGHIDDTTLEIIIWVFMMLSILSSNLMTYNHQIFRRLAWLSRKVLKQRGIQDTDDGPMHEEDERDILLLGFHRIASMMVAEFEQHNPKLLRKLQVVEFNQAMQEPLLRRGIKFSYGDFSSADVLEHCFHGEPKIVISTTPDTMLQGILNKFSKELLCRACAADNFKPVTGEEVHEKGALATHSPYGKRIALERFQERATRGLRQRGYDLMDAQIPIEYARSIKTEEEIVAIRYGIKVVEETLRCVEHSALNSHRMRRRVCGDATPELWAKDQPLDAGERLTT
eukprot:g772.t1